MATLMSLLIALGFAGAVIIQSPVAPASAAISGLVLDDGRTPIAGAQVTLFPHGIPSRSGPARLPLPDVRRTATTDRDGRYAFDGLAAGRYSITVRKAGFALLNGRESLVVDLEAGERHQAANVTLQKGAVIAGRVLDEAGEPLSDARVTAMRKPPAPPSAPPMRGNVLLPAGPGAQTNDLGEFRLFGLAPGDYYVQVTPHLDFGGSAAPRARTMLPTYFPGTSDAVAADPISVGAGQTFGDIEIRMIGAPAFQLSGVVLDEAGRPVADAMVKLVVEEPGERPLFMMGPWNQSRTDASGKFTITNVTNGAYSLLAIAPVVTSGPADRRAAGSGATGSFMSFGSSVGAVSGTVGGGVTTETSNGTTIQYSDDAATRLSITVNQADVGGLQLIVRRPAR